MPNWPPSTGEVTAGGVIDMMALEVDIVLTISKKVLQQRVPCCTVHVDLDKVP